MTSYHPSRGRHFWPSATAAAWCTFGLAWPAIASTTLEVEPRVLTQTGLGIALAVNLLHDETNAINNFNTTPPACAKLASAGSIQTLSFTKISSTTYKSAIDTYFHAACKKPYIKAEVTLSYSTGGGPLNVDEAASYLQLNGMALGKLQIAEKLSVANNIETLNGLGKFMPAGGQSVADVGFTCSIPTAKNAKTGTCQSGVAQTFASLKLSIASVVPFTITASANTNAPSVTFAGKTSDVRTGPAGTLSITAPATGTLGIGGGGTPYTSTSTAGAVARFTLFPPGPTHWTVTDTKNNARFLFRVVSNATRAARAAVATVSPAKGLAAMSLDQSGTGKVKFSDGSAAVIRGFLAAD